MGTTSKAIIGTGLAALALGATSAVAMPVRDLRIEGANTTAVTVSASAYSPPSANCGAYYGIRILTPGGAILRNKLGRFNACAGQTADGYWSVGYPQATFKLGGLPIGRYRVCVAAGQEAAAGWYAHVICRWRAI